MVSEGLRAVDRHRVDRIPGGDSGNRLIDREDNIGGEVRSGTDG